MERLQEVLQAVDPMRIELTPISLPESSASLGTCRPKNKNSRRSHPVKNPKPVQGIFIGGLTTWSFLSSVHSLARGLPLFLCRYCFTGVLAIMWIRRESNPQPFYSATTTSSCRALTMCAGLYGGSHSRPICRSRRTRTFDSRLIPDALPPHT